MLWFFIAVLISQTLPAENIDMRQAYLYAEDAYRAGYPLVLQELIRQTMTEGDTRKVLMGQLLHERKFPSPEDTQIRWTNLDALYTFAWLDLTKDPYIFTVPKFDDRLFLFPIMSAWNEEVYLVRKEGTYALVGPYWKGSLPKETKIIRSPTNNIFIAGRIFSSGSNDDLERVHAIQDGLSLKPLSFDESDHVYAIDDWDEKKLDSVDKTLSEEGYYAVLAKALKGNPPPSDSRDISKKLSKIGIKEGVSYLTPSSDKKIAEALRIVPKEMAKKLGPPKNTIQSLGGWSLSLREGVFGSDYMRRTLSMMLGQAFPQETAYLFTDQDGASHKLDGNNRYILHISKEKIPPVKGTWSLTAYDRHGKLIANALNRYSIQGENSSIYNKDGSLDIFIQNRYPGSRKEANWLPVPEGPFSLMLRLYLPEKEVYEKNWIMPGVKKEDF